MKTPAQASMGWPVAVGTAAGLSNVPAKIVRHCESLDLVVGVARADRGYRDSESRL